MENNTSICPNCSACHLTSFTHDHKTVSLFTLHSGMDLLVPSLLLPFCVCLIPTCLPLSSSGIEKKGKEDNYRKSLPWKKKEVEQLFMSTNQLTRGRWTVGRHLWSLGWSVSFQILCLPPFLLLFPTCFFVIWIDGHHKVFGTGGLFIICGYGGWKSRFLKCKQ